jgi:hypothetical protein
MIILLRQKIYRGSRRCRYHVVGHRQIMGSWMDVRMDELKTLQASSSPTLQLSKSRRCLNRMDRNEWFGLDGFDGNEKNKQLLFSAADDDEEEEMMMAMAGLLISRVNVRASGKKNGKKVDPEWKKSCSFLSPSPKK